MIIDTHQHFWHIGMGDAKAPEDHKIKGLPEGICGTILRFHENQWCLDLAAEEPYIVGVCGGIKSGPDFASDLEKFSADPLFLGISCSGKELENIENSNVLSDYQLLADKDLELDVLRAIPTFYGGPKEMQAFKGTEDSMAGLFKIAERIPNLRIVIQHAGGMPIDGGPVPKEWETIYRRLAEHPNFFIKVSGLMERDATRPENEKATELLSFYRPFLETLWDIFGEDKLFYASNWPVCEHVGDFMSNSLRFLRPFFAEKGNEAYEKFFWKNSKKVYKWNPRLPSQQ